MKRLMYLDGAMPDPCGQNTTRTSNSILLRLLLLYRWPAIDRPPLENDLDPDDHSVMDNTTTFLSTPLRFSPTWLFHEIGVQNVNLPSWALHLSLILPP
jgi:hypothetical protein